jgi:hypothetical protein
MKDAKPFVKREHSMTIPIYIVASAIDWVGGYASFTRRVM